MVIQAHVYTARLDTVFLFWMLVNSSTQMQLSAVLLSNHHSSAILRYHQQPLPSLSTSVVLLLIDLMSQHPTSSDADLPKSLAEEGARV